MAQQVIYGELLGVTYGSDSCVFSFINDGGAANSPVVVSRSEVHVLTALAFLIRREAKNYRLWLLANYIALPVVCGRLGVEVDLDESDECNCRARIVLFKSPQTAASPESDDFEFKTVSALRSIVYNVKMGEDDAARLQGDMLRYLGADFCRCDHCKELRKSCWTFYMQVMAQTLAARGHELPDNIMVRCFKCGEMHLVRDSAEPVWWLCDSCLVDATPLIEL